MSVWLVLAIPSLIAGATLWLDQAPGPSSLPATTPVVRGDIQVVVSAVGRVQPSKRVVVGAQVSGQLQELQARVGDFVREGDLLARIDASVQRNRVQASRAGLDAEKALLTAREAAVELAASNIRRQRELVDRGSGSRYELESAINQLAAAESALAELGARISGRSAMLARDEAQLRYSEIVAPMSGTVVSVGMTEGQTLNASQQTPTILEIANLTRMTVRAEVSEADIGKVKAGSEAYFTTLGGGSRRWQGSVHQVLPTPTVRNNVVFYPVLLEVANEDGALLPQMTTQIFFVLHQVENVLTVPMVALEFEENRHGFARVGAITDQGVVQEKVVEIGLNDRIHAEVKSGLAEGDKVVVSQENFGV